MCIRDRYMGDLLTRFLQGELVSLAENAAPPDDMFKFETGTAIETTSDGDSELKPRKKLRPLLKKLSEVRPPSLHYAGVAYGLSEELFRFWRKNGFEPVYLRQTANEVTGEHSCIMLKALAHPELPSGWLNAYTSDFRRRLVSLLSMDFSELDVKTSLSALDAPLTTNAKGEDDEEGGDGEQSATREELELYLTKFDVKRLEAYSKNMADYRLIADLLPSLARLFFLHRLPGSFRLSYAQAAALLGMGLQHKAVEKVAEALNMPVSQLLALFNKAVKKLTTFVKGVFSKEIENEVRARRVKADELLPLKKGMDSDVEDEGRAVVAKIEAPKDIEEELEGRKAGKGANEKKVSSRYAVDADEEEIASAIAQGKTDNIVLKRRPDAAQDEALFAEDRRLPRKKNKKK
eukprot:TRINITY_DN10786_c0_g2_i1.p1 TRINITY_DN10786_c0_g2~~TRINITY_DN10786_c0_g2_i1.p1  ORF type:complete len:405 (-),score=159.46 TRINITY_DN10786_c0_g2_i1:521-1735(-)